MREAYRENILKSESNHIFHPSVIMQTKFRKSYRFSFLKKKKTKILTLGMRFARENGANDY